MSAGILAAITWGLETVVIGIALAMSPLVNSVGEAIVLAPFISTFIHDFFSAVFSWIYNGVRGKLPSVFRSLFKTKSGKWVVIAAIIGGPVGMTGYIMAVTYMGASIGAIASAIFPAIGAVLAYIFLKEKMKWYQWLFLLATLAGVYGLSYDPTLNITNFWLGIIGALLCAFGWGIEAVILAKCLRDGDVTDEGALMIRQTTSALFYGAVLLPVLGLIGLGEGGKNPWEFTVSLFKGTGWLIPAIVVAGLFATASYLFYYRAIAQIGASKAMALNITYTAWAIIFALIYDVVRHLINSSHEIAYPSWLTIVCAVVVLVCSIFAASDFKEIFKKKSKA
ncbi:MAG: DMT family transporter [Clostridia bacterium]|nr:DMT family transporter [Clostridia bacterium]